MAPAFISSVDPYNITLPPGLSRAQTTEGGTAFVDGSGNAYLPTNGGYQLSTSVKIASAPIAMNSPVAPVADQSGQGEVRLPPGNYAGNYYPYGAAVTPMGNGQYRFSGNNAASIMSGADLWKAYPDAAQAVGAPQPAPSAPGSQPQNQGSTGSSSSSSSSSLPSTGNPQLDKIQADLEALVNSGKAVIPPGLEITPDLTQQFLTWAHQAVDPQTQQLIQNEVTNINASLKNMAVNFQNAQGEAIQNFGTNLATEQNASGASGTALSGLRNLTEGNMVASTNRTLSGLQSQAQTDIGGALRGGAADVGSANAGSLFSPTLSGAQVSSAGGSRGSLFGGSDVPLNYSYNPSSYTVGAIPTQQNTTVNDLANNYLGQYTTLAGNNSSRSMRDLIGGITGLPSGYQIPSSIQ